MNFAVLDVDRRPEVMAILRLLNEWGTVRYFSPDEEEAFIALLPEVDVLLIRLYKVDETLLLKGRKLKAIIKAGVGVDHIDVSRNQNGNQSDYFSRQPYLSGRIGCVAHVGLIASPYSRIRTYMQRSTCTLWAQKCMARF